MCFWLGCLGLWKIPGATDLSCATGVLSSSLDLIQLWLFFHTVSVLFHLCEFPLLRLLPLLALGTGAPNPTITPCRWVTEVVPHADSEGSHLPQWVLPTNLP